MLMRLFFHLDKLVTCDRPSSCILWIGLLAFHLALVNNPQEALVIWAFASTLYYGNREKGVKFAKEHAQMHVNFVPEISGSSDFKSDEEIAEGVTLLASLVQDSIDALTNRDSLFESLRRYPTSPCSGFVFISKTKGDDVAEIFRVLLKDIESYNSGKNNFEIDYQKLGKGYVNETRFVLGKIILETMSSGVVKGGIEVVKVEKTQLQPDVNEESCHLSLSDLMKHQVLKDRKHERGLSTSNPELKNEMVKKRKFVEKKSSLSKPEVAIMNPEKVEIVEYQEMGKKHQKIIETCQSPLEETNMKQGNVLDDQTCHLQEHEVTIEMQEDVENDKCEANSKRHLKVVEKGERLLSQDKVTKKPKVVGRSKIKQKKVLEKKQLQFAPPMVVREKQDEVVVKEKGSRPLLSSFFK
ncbi:uncharacterized protein LOC132171793 [Corylus avellana]|uniref:uncharacterized protein LOC132171793 n=1 Tax=Corylus avellana TaxID=13451 RepID=UPI00286B7096|nr:uncharacterized protein LOC132171793 [Corylus avellana]